VRFIHLGERRLEEVADVEPGEQPDPVDALRVPEWPVVGELEVAPGLGGLAEVAAVVARLELVGHTVAVAIPHAESAAAVLERAALRHEAQVQGEE
jgi:hypothetical protein